MKTPTMKRYLSLLDLSRKRTRGEVDDDVWIASVTGELVHGLLRAADIADDEAGQLLELADYDEATKQIGRISLALSSAVEAALAPAEQDAGTR